MSVFVPICVCACWGGQCFNEGADIEGQRYIDLLGGITSAMNRRVGDAMERLKIILSKPVGPTATSMSTLKSSLQT